MALSPPPKSIAPVKEAIEILFKFNDDPEVINEELWNMYRDSLESGRGGQLRADVYKALVDLVKVSGEYINQQ